VSSYWEIHDAVSCGDLERVKSLLIRAEYLQLGGRGSVAEAVSSRDDFGRTLLHRAVERGSRDIVELLLANKASVNATDNQNRTPLHLAAKSGNKPIVELLVTAKADVNARDGYRATPLHRAAEMGNKDAIEVLLANKANKNDTDQWDDTPFDYAVRAHQIEAEELLRPRGLRKLLHRHRDRILESKRRFRFWIAYLRGRRACRQHDREMLRRGIGSWTISMEERAMDKAIEALGIPLEHFEPSQRVGFRKGWYRLIDPRHIDSPKSRWQ